MTERTADGRIRTTDWEDVQYRFGNKVGQYIRHEDAILRQKENDEKPDNFRAYDPAREKFEEKLSVIELDSDEELQAIRHRTLQSMRASHKNYSNITCARYAEYKEVVTEQSMHRNVLVVIHEAHNTACQKLLHALNSLAGDELRAVSIVSISAREAKMAIEESRLPCVVLYVKGAVCETIFGLEEWGGELIDEGSVHARLSQNGFA